MKTTCLFLVPALAVLTSCNGLFGGIYDEFDAAEKPAASSCFIARDADGKGGTLQVDVRPYTTWTFLDLHALQADTANTADSLASADPPFAWDIALHRWDVKTHGGSALSSNYGSVEEAVSAGTLPAEAFVADVDSAVVVDMSTKMEGYLGYSQSMVNPVLSQWIDIDTREMPPIYTLSGRVYIVQLTDGTRAALQFTNYMDDASRKGFATIRYRYPLP